MQSAKRYLDGLTLVVLTQTLILVLKAGCNRCGDEEARTPGLRRAKAALSQLSYIPFSSYELRMTSYEWKKSRYSSLVAQHSLLLSRWAWLDSNQRPLPYQRNALTG